MDMTQPRRQQRQPGLPILASGIGLQHRLDCEGVPQVVDPRPEDADRGSRPAFF